MRELAEVNGQLRAELRPAHAQHARFEQRLQSARAELGKVKTAVVQGVGIAFDFEHRAALERIVGAGYEHTESGSRLLRLHAQEVVQLIQKKGGDDMLRHIELASAVKQRLTGKKEDEEA